MVKKNIKRSLEQFTSNGPGAFEMYFDLNQPIAVEGARLELADKYERLAAAIKLGYTTIAHNHVVHAGIGDDHKCPVEHLDPKLVLSGKDRITSGQGKGLLKDEECVLQLKRLTLITGDISECKCIQDKSPGLKEYDIIAIVPKSAAVAEQACASLDVDLIGVDLTAFQSFSYKQSWLRKAAERGIYIELCYSTALRDSHHRRKFFRGAHQFYGLARGKNLILSSGATCALEMRGPYDVMNLANFVGMKDKHAKDSILARCRDVIKKVQMKSMHKGAVKIETIPKAESDKEEANSSTDQLGEVNELSGTSSSDCGDSKAADDVGKPEQNVPKLKPTSLKPSTLNGWSQKLPKQRSGNRGKRKPQRKSGFNQMTKKSRKGDFGAGY